MFTTNYLKSEYNDKPVVGSGDYSISWTHSRVCENDSPSVLSPSASNHMRQSGCDGSNSVIKRERISLSTEHRRF